MKKADQQRINTEVISAFEQFNNSNFYPYANNVKKYPLRSCNAIVYCNNRYAVLRSYNAIVAIIDYLNNSNYDFLRYVYGYTATSAQHISKFFNDYGKYNRIYRYY